MTEREWELFKAAIAGIPKEEYPAIIGYLEVEICSRPEKLAQVHRNLADIHDWAEGFATREDITEEYRKLAARDAELTRREGSETE